MQSAKVNKKNKKAKTKAAEHLLEAGATASTQQDCVPIEEIEKRVQLASARQDKSKSVPTAWEVVRSTNPKPIGLLNNGNLPDLDLPAELDERRIGVFVEYEDEVMEDWVPLSMREKTGKRRLFSEKKAARTEAVPAGTKKKKKKSVSNDGGIESIEKALTDANNVDEGELFQFLSNV